MSRVPSRSRSRLRSRAAILVLALAGAGLLAGSVAGQDGAATSAGDERLRSLFPRRALVLLPQADGEALARLELDEKLLGSVRPDLSDLRLLDAAGREIPYLLDPGLGEGTRVREGIRIPVRILEARRETLAQDEAPDVYREVYDLEPPSEEAPEGSWELVLGDLPPVFVRSFELGQVYGAGDAGVEVEGSVFRLGGGEARERTRLPLPQASGRPWRLTLEGEGDGFLAPTLFYEASGTVAAGEALRVPLKVLSTTSEGGTTTLLAERPRGILTEALRLDASTRAFRRPVVVWDDGPGARTEAVGRGVLSRLPGVGGAQVLEIPLGAASGDRLRIEISDGDSPPLEPIFAFAVIRRPALVFVPPAAAGDGSVATLYFGGGRARRPVYDLAAFEPWLGPPVAGAEVEVAKALLDRGRLLPATMTAPSANPAFDATPALAFAMRPGAPVDSRLYRWRRSLRASPSPEGLVRLPLAAEDVAQARPDLGDLRLVDGEGRQQPYLLDRSAASQRLVLPVKSVRTEDGRSRYELELPASPIRLSRLEIDPAEPFFDRAAELRARPAGASRERTVERTRLSRRADAALADPPPLSLGADSSSAVESLALVIEDGDDAPLELASVAAEVSLPVLSFVAPAGEYSLLLGAESEAAPSYELARARDLVLSVSAGSAEAGELVANPDYSATARLGRGSGLRQLGLWLVLGLAVVVLTVITLRLVREPSASDS